MLFAGGPVAMPAPTGARIRHNLSAEQYDKLVVYGAITMVPGTDHEHAEAAALRALAYAHICGKARSRACYLLAGESNTRLRCLQVLPPVPTNIQWPVHHQVPDVDVRDALRVQRAMDNIRLGTAMGTTCHCKLSVCVHFQARYNDVCAAFADDDDWPVPFVLVLCDVYAVTPAMVRDFYLDFSDFLTARGFLPQEVYNAVSASVVYRIGHQWKYEGVLFGGEYIYHRVEDGSVHARVEGNGDVDYIDSRGDDWFTTEPSFGGLTWQVDRVMLDVVIHRAVFTRLREINRVQGLTPNVSRELARDFVRTGSTDRLYLPLKDYVYCRRLDGFGGLPVPRVLVEHLRAMAAGAVRDNRLRQSMYSRCNLILEGRFPRCVVDVPPSLRSTVTELAVGEVFNFPDTVEMETRDVEVVRNRVREQYNNTVALVTPEAHFSKFMILVAVLLGVVKFVPKITAWYKYGTSAALDMALLAANGVWFAAVGIYFILLGLTFTMWAGADRTRVALVRRGIPTGRGHWFMLLMIMFAPLVMADTTPHRIRFRCDVALPEYDHVTAAYAYHQGDFGPVELPDIDDGAREPAGSYAARGLPPVPQSTPAEVTLDRCEFKCNRETIGAYLFGGYSQTCPVTVPAACWCSLNTSVRARVTRKTIGTSLEAWREPANNFIKEVRKRMTDTMSFLEPTPWFTWLAREGYTAATRQQLTYAKETLEREALVARDYVSKLFPKVEKFVKQTVPGVLTEYAPRAIQGMTDRLQVTIGPWFHAASKTMGQIFNADEAILYGPGKTSEQIGAWFDKWFERFPWILEIDAVKLDLHLKEAALDTQVEIYKALDCPYEVLEAKRQENLGVRGVSTTGVNFRCRAVKRSGDSDTTFGNTCSCITCWLGALQSAGYVLEQDFAMAVMGDDVVVLLRVKPDLDHLLGFVRSMGIESEMTLHQHRANCTFLSALFYPSADGTVLAPMLGRVFARLGWATHAPGMEKWGTNKWGRYMYSVARGLQTTVAHVPIMSTYIDRMLSLGIANGDRINAFKHKITAERAHNLSHDVYEFLEERYGLIPAAVDEMEDEILSITSFPHAWKHPGFQRVIERDCL